MNAPALLMRLAPVALAVVAGWVVAARCMRSLEDELHRDVLTGIGNRRAFERALEDLESRELRHGHRHSFVMIDLDGFKGVNNTLGHQAGDEILRVVAQHFRDVVVHRTGGTGCLYRFGGDEFAILLEGWDPVHAEALVEEMRQRLDAEPVVRRNSVRVSAGIASWPEHADRVEALVSLADRALYQAKRAGRNRTTIYAPVQLESGTATDSLGLLRVLASVLAAAVDAKDAYTHAHSHNVADLSGYLARTLELPDDLVDEIFLAGLLHDVGKIGVEDAILTKPAKLDQDEWEQITGHCEIGYRILNSIEGAERIRDMVLFHHERIDGAGYPTGISGSEIPIGARIIAVADSFDAMTADRVYSPGIDPDDAVDEIIRCSGSQFDPTVVAALCELMLYETPSDQPTITTTDMLDEPGDMDVAA